MIRTDSTPPVSTNHVRPPKFVAQNIDMAWQHLDDDQQNNNDEWLTIGIALFLRDLEYTLTIETDATKLASLRRQMKKQCHKLVNATINADYCVTEGQLKTREIAQLMQKIEVDQGKCTSIDERRLLRAKLRLHCKRLVNATLSINEPPKNI